MATCGQGAERFTMMANNGSKEGICEDLPGINNSAFYLHQAHDYCVGAEHVSKPKKTYNGHWCYVQAGCRSLGSGHVVNKEVAWKTCTKSDQRLADLPPAQLFALADKSGLNHPQLALAAYGWDEVKNMFPPQPSRMD